MAVETPDGGLGTPAPSFALTGVDDRVWTLDTVRGENGVVVAFICNHCPYVVATVEDMVRDAADLAARGVGFAAICSNDASAYPADSFPEMKRFAQRYRFAFPYLHDESQDVARAYGAVCTPDVFGFGPDLRLRYRGRLDATRPGKPSPDGAREMRDAMRLVAEGRDAPATQAPSIGCSIKWRAAA